MVRRHARGAAYLRNPESFLGRMTDNSRIRSFGQPSLGRFPRELWFRPVRLSEEADSRVILSKAL